MHQFVNEFVQLIVTGDKTRVQRQRQRERQRQRSRMSRYYQGRKICVTIVRKKRGRDHLWNYNNDFA